MNMSVGCFAFNEMAPNYFQEAPLGTWVNMGKQVGWLIDMFSSAEKKTMKSGALPTLTNNVDHTYIKASNRNGP